jgi:hypothetical protein
MTAMERGEAIYALVQQAEQDGITLWTTHGELSFRAAPGAMTPAYRELLKTNKSDIIAALSEPAFESRPRPERVPILKYYTQLWDKVLSGALGVAFTNATNWAARVRYPLSLQALQAAVSTLVSRHPILSSKVVETDTGWAFSYDHPVTICIEDLSGTPKQSREALCSERVSEWIWRPFDARDALFRFFVLKLSPSDHVFGFVAHHFISDASSVNLLAAELAAVYMQLTNGVSHSLAPDPLQYSDYIQGYNEWLDSIALPFRIEYWKQQLRDAPATRLPADREIDLDEKCSALSLPFEMDANALGASRALARRTNSSLFSVVLAAYALALSRCLGQTDLIILMMHHGRDDPRVAAMVGSTQNQLALRFRVAAEMSIDAVIAEVDRVVVAAHQYRVPYHYVRTALPDIGTPEIFSELHFFDYSADLEAAAARPGSNAESFSIPGSPDTLTSPRHFQAPKLALAVNPNGLTGSVVYLPAQYEETTIRRFVDAFIGALRAAS